MRTLPAFLNAAASALVVAVAARAPAVSAEDPALADDLARVARRRILFGHQSVGANLLAGVARLSAAHGGAVRVVELRGRGPIAPGTFAHAPVGDNGAPRTKLDAFAALLASVEGPPPDVAFVKLCYADFDAGTDAGALFDSYRRALADLARRYPAIPFVHVTAPLTTVQDGPRAAVKKALGVAPWGLAENVRREAYNARLRAEYAGRAPIFDLARLEATAPDGTVTRAAHGGRAVLALAPGSTDDGGHLNAGAQDRIARALIALLAGLP
jgi:lysophospholipase L1-like esterase